MSTLSALSWAPPDGLLAANAAQSYSLEPSAVRTQNPVSRKPLLTSWSFSQKARDLDAELFRHWGSYLEHFIIHVLQTIEVEYPVSFRSKPKDEWEVKISVIGVAKAGFSYSLPKNEIQD